MNLKTYKYILLAFAVGLFRPLASQAQKVYTLQQCRALAKENNIKVRRSRLEIQSAKEQQKEAWAKYFPTITANGTYFVAPDYLLQQEVSMSPEVQQKLAGIVHSLGLPPAVLASLPTTYTIEAIKHGTLVSLMAMEPIYAGGRIVNANKLAKVQTEVKELMLSQSADDVSQTTELYYNQLLSLYEQQKALDAAEKQLTSIFNDATNAYEAGIANKNDILSVQLKQNDIAINRLKLQNGITLSKLVLAQYMGKAGEDIEIDRTLTTHLPAPSTYAMSHATALENRIETQLLDKKVEAQRLLTKVKQGEMLPTLAVGVAGMYQDLSNKGRFNAVGMATLSLPISNWWSNRGLKRQKIAQQIAMEEKEDSRQLLLIQMQSAYNNLETAYKQIQLARKSMEQSAENLRINEDYYQAGTGTMTNLLDAQTRDQQARNQYTEAVTSYLNCRTAYLIATGRGSE